eukprot:jgi/Orpsp1_1/1181170/evm.model.c7180000076173.1
MNKTLNIYVQDKKNSINYTKKSIEYLKINNYSKNLFLKSTITLSTPCFYTLSDIREFKKETKFKNIKNKYKNNVNEKYININFKTLSNSSIINNIYNNDKFNNENGNSNSKVIIQIQPFQKRANINENYMKKEVQEEKEEKGKDRKMKLHSRSYTLSSLNNDEDESGLLILWIVLGIIGFMFGFIFLSYIINYVLYHRQRNYPDHPNRENSFTSNITPMSLDIMNFGHNQQNLSKEDLDKCPVFRFKIKRHQYKNSNSKKINSPYIYNKNLMKPKNTNNSSNNQSEMCSITDRVVLNPINKETLRDNDRINYDNTSINRNNNSSIRYIFDEPPTDDNKKDYATSVRSASITSSYSEIYNHLSFNPDTSSSAEICAICIEHYQLNDELRKLPCGHEFHKE